MKLKGKVAVITGTSRGIGKAIAVAFAREGAAVAIASRTTRETEKIRGTLYETAQAIRDQGGIVLPARTDITKDADVRALAQQTLDEFGRVDILVNNAATNTPAHFKDISIKQWDAIMAVNLRGAVLCTKAVLPAMIQQQRGHIINISSIVTRTPQHLPMTGLAYDVTKAAIDRFTTGLAEELRPFAVAVNALMPDNTDTEGWAYLNPKADRSRWQAADMWGSYAVWVASQNSAAFTGKILSKEDLERGLFENDFQT